MKLYRLADVDGNIISAPMTAADLAAYVVRQDAPEPTAEPTVRRDPSNAHTHGRSLKLCDLVHES